MAIKEIAPPAESSEKFNAWLDHKNPVGERSLLLNIDPYGKTMAIRVFHITLDEIISENGFSNAELVSWRYIHMDSKGPCAIEIQVGADQKENRLLEVDRGQMIADYKSLLAVWNDIKELEKEDFEIAYLRIFALKIGTLWLRATERKNDFFIPIPPHFHGLVSGKLYSADQFLDITRQAVNSFMSGGDTNPRDIFGGGAYDPFLGG